jgi:hypothetical protein
MHPRFLYCGFKTSFPQEKSEEKFKKANNLKAEKWVPFIKHTKLNAHKVELRRVYHLLLHEDFSK